jgi:hypothetical protein
MVVTDVIPHQPLQAVFVQYDDVVEEIPTTVSNPARYQETLGSALADN